jgi:hypothetical protein
MLFEMRAVINEQPGAEDHEATGERNEMNGVEQIKRAAGERQQRKGANAAGTALIGMGEEFLEGEAEKKTQAEKQRNAGRRRRRDHADWAQHSGEGAASEL